MAILTIHSHVSYGHVGHSAVVYPLQRLGHEVWPIHTVLLSHHPGHNGWHGLQLESSYINEVLTGIKAHGILNQCEAVLTGYLGSKDIGQATLNIWKEVRRANPSALIICDPILGDEIEGIYVPKSLVSFYRERAIPSADLIFPNRFELELLSGIKVVDPPSAVKAARRLINIGPKTVIATSIPAGQNLSTILVTKNTAQQILTPCVKVSVKGSGDLLAALYLGDLLARGVSPIETLMTAVDTIYSLLETTEANNLEELPLLTIQTPLGNRKSRHEAVSI